LRDSSLLRYAASCAGLVFVLSLLGAAADPHVLPDNACVLCKLNAHTPVIDAVLIAVPVPDIGELALLTRPLPAPSEAFTSSAASRSPPRSAAGGCSGRA
jgi:hypothetical protein